MESTIPLVNLEDYLSEDQDRKANFVKELGESLESLGFVAVTGHGIPLDLLAKCYTSAEEVFALPDETKAKYEQVESGRQRGYTSFGIEHAKDTVVPDLKEFWQVGREIDPEHPLAVCGDVPMNLFPTEHDVFGKNFQAMYRSFEGFGLTLLEAVGKYLGVEDGFFEKRTEGANHIIRVINYPDMGTVPAGAVRSAQHEDINLMTVLPAASRPGLQLMTHEGEWLAVEAPEGCMICDTGDMMQILTGGKLPATTHRVVNPEASDGGRMSMPFFIHPHLDVMLDPIQDGPYEAVLTRDYFDKRLREIGVKK